MRPDEIIKIVEYIKEQTDFKGDIFININNNAVPIEFIEEQIAKATDINNSDKFDVLYAGNLSYLLKLWEKENEDL